MTVLCLVELDGADPADASLRALTLARTLGDPSIGGVVFADPADVPAAALADFGVTDAYVIEPGSLGVPVQRPAGLGPDAGRARHGDGRDRGAGGRHRPRQ
jgi:hypothetical protein